MDYKDVTYDIPDDVLEIIGNNDGQYAILETEHTYIVIDIDEMPESPRDWSNLGHMVCFHRRYDLGDKHEFQHEIKGVDARTGYEDYYMDDPRGLMEFVERVDVVALPLYLYDHSGITMSYSHTYPYNDRWDSGKVGYIYVTKEELCKEYGYKRATKKLIERGIKYLQGEVDVYDQYLRGDVYCFKQFCKYCWDEIDSCRGFYGDDWKTNGLLDYIHDEKCDACQHREQAAWLSLAEVAVGE